MPPLPGLTKCSVPDHGIGRIGVHICHWSKVKIQAVGFEVASDDLPHGTGIGRVPCCTYCLGTLVLGQIKAGSIGQPGHAAALLVHGGQQTGSGCCLKICQKLFQLLRAFTFCRNTTMPPTGYFFSPCRSAQVSLVLSDCPLGSSASTRTTNSCPTFPAEAWQQAVPLPGQSGLLPKPFLSAAEPQTTAQQLPAG